MPQVLAIPPQQLVAFTVLRDLGAAGVDRLTELIKAQKVLLDEAELQRAISPLLGGQAELVSEVLTGLSLLQRTGLRAEAVLDDVTETLQRRSCEIEPTSARPPDCKGPIVQGYAGVPGLPDMTAASLAPGAV